MYMYACTIPYILPHITAYTHVALHITLLWKQAFWSAVTNLLLLIDWHIQLQKLEVAANQLHAGILSVQCKAIICFV